MLIRSPGVPTPPPASPAPKNHEAPDVRSLMDGVKDTFIGTNTFLDEHPLLETSIGVGMSVSRGLKAFPEFIYPTILNASGAERSQIYAALDHLPLQDVNTVKSITMVDSIHNSTPGRVTLGRAHDHVFTNQIELSRAELTTPERLQATLTHEVGHTKDYETQWFGVLGRESRGKPWGEGPHVTDYATTNNKEDFAESYEDFHLRPERLKETNPAKYKRMQELSEQNFLEKLMDREEFRETGKWLGQRVGPTKTIRNIAEGAHFFAGFAQIARGVSQLSGGRQNDPASHYQGVLNVAAGTMFASGVLGVPGMAVQAANTALTNSVRRGDISAVDADAAVRSVTDPAEHLVRSLASKFRVVEDFKPLEEDPLYKTRALGIAVGGATGGLLGSLAGPYAGVLAGYHLAGGAGGAAGLIIGGLAGFYLGTEVGGRLGGKVGDFFG